jgi:hypothetical protein
VNIWKLLIIFSIGFIYQGNAHIYNHYLHGKVINFSEDGIEYPVKNEAISIEGTGFLLKANTNFEGKFHIDYTSGGKPLLKSGDKVRLQMNLSDKWFMLTPYDGYMFLPENSDNHDINVRLLGNKSKIITEFFTININNDTTKKVEYCIQIISVKSKLSANNFKDEFNKNWKNKYNSYIETVNLNGTDIYKVLISVSPYSKDNIINTHQKIKKSNKYKDAFIRLTVR